jgi:hypothetical protein
MGSRHATTVTTSTSVVSWNSTYNNGKQYVLPNGWLLLTNLQVAVTPKTEIYTSVALADTQISGKPNVCRMKDAATAFCVVVSVICALLEYYTACIGKSLTDVSEQPIGPIFSGQEI